MAQSLKEKIVEAIRTEEANQAFALAKQVQDLLDQTADKQSAEYVNLKKVWAQLRMIAFRYTNEKTIPLLFSEHIVDILQMPDEISLRSLIDSRLLAETTNDPRIEIKESIKQAILKSQQRIGGTNIMLGSDEVSPTVENWMKLFFTHLESSEKISSVNVARFFSSSKDYNALPQKEKNMLRRLIDLYKYLVISPDEPEGYVEYTLLQSKKNGLLAVGGGEIRQMEDEKTLDHYEELAKQDKLSALSLAMLQIDYPDRFKKYAKRDLSKLVSVSTPQVVQEQMQAFLQDQRKEYAVLANTQLPADQTILLPFVEPLGLGSSSATLSRFIERLKDLLQNEKTLVSFLSGKQVKDVFQANIPAHFSDQDQETIHRVSYSPVAVQALLEIFLKTGYGLPEEQAKWHAYDLLQVLPPQLKSYKTIVTYDVKENQLVWRY